MTLRGFAYTAVGCLAQRVPTLFHARIDIARSFFAGAGGPRSAPAHGHTRPSQSCTRHTTQQKKTPANNARAHTPCPLRRTIISAWCAAWPGYTLSLRMRVAVEREHTRACCTEFTRQRQLRARRGPLSLRPAEARARANSLPSSTPLISTHQHTISTEIRTEKESGAQPLHGRHMQRVQQLGHQLPKHICNHVTHPFSLRRQNHSRRCCRQSARRTRPPLT